MEISGVVIKKETQTGVSRTGKEWKKINFVIKYTEGVMQRNLAFDLFGDDKINNNPFEENDNVTVSFDLESNEWGGRWYTVCNAWRITPLDPSKKPTPIPSPLEVAATAHLDGDSALPF